MSEGMDDSVTKPLLQPEETGTQYQHEDDDGGGDEHRRLLSPGPPKKGIQYRYVTAAMGFLGFFNVRSPIRGAKGKIKREKVHSLSLSLSLSLSR